MAQFQQFSPTLRLAIRTAQTAGEAIMPLFRSSDLEAKLKADHSYVTAADYRSNDIILATLRAYDPETPVLSEETKEEFVKAHATMPSTCWIVDPLDGTSIFKAGQTAFLVMIARMEDHRPQIAICYSPYTGETYCAEKGVGSFKIEADGTIRKLWREPVKTSQILRQTAMEFYDDPAVADIAQAFAQASGFFHPVNVRWSHDAPHFMLSIASGESDLALHYLNKKCRDSGGGAGLWDHAPMDLILSEANCKLVNDSGKPFLFLDANHVSQMMVVLAPGLSTEVMAETVARQLNLHNLPRPLN